jgi:hypothetical protein
MTQSKIKNAYLIIEYRYKKLIKKTNKFAWINQWNRIMWGPGWRGRYSDSLRTGPSRGGEIFCTRPDRPWGSPSLLYNGYWVFSGSKAAGAWRWPSTSSSAEVIERVELYLFSPSGPSWPVIGWTVPLALSLILLCRDHRHVSAILQVCKNKNTDKVIRCRNHYTVKKNRVIFG